jgi:class 3 adenylate cyclase
MSDQSAISYAKAEDGTHIAYRVSGTGPPDLLIMSPWVLPMEGAWPARDLVHQRLTSIARVIEYDRRGVGLSDPVSATDPPTIEHWMQDALAVLDAVGTERAAVFGGEQVSGLTGMLLAASHPDRVAALVLVNTTARIAWAPDNEWGMRAELQDKLEVRIERHWPDAFPIEFVAPSAKDDVEFRDWWTRAQQMGASPSVASALSRVIFESDVRDVLPLIRTPTLVLHTSDNVMLPIQHGRHIAEMIPEAKLVEIPGADQIWSLPPTANVVVDEIEEFLTGMRRGAVHNRVLATVLFTDIVSSTERTVAAGDRAWSLILDRHDAAVRRQLDRFRGREVRTTGDGFLATFDGPARAVQCACAIREASRQIGIDVRAGLHTGEIELRGKDVSGIAVNIAARVADRAGPGEVVVSRTVTDLVAGSGLAFTACGEAELKGVPGLWPLFSVAA